jgi:CHAD domain-containing protein
VLAAPAPAASGEYKSVSRNGVVQDALGNWVEAYVERDMFADYVDEDGVTVTKHHKSKRTQPVRMKKRLRLFVQNVTS